MTDYLSTEAGRALVDECKACITEAVFASRDSLIQGYHALGERIATDDNFQAFANGNKEACNTLARNIKVSTRTVYYAIAFYNKFPDISKLPEGKNISWTKIITKYLPAPKDDKEEEDEVSKLVREILTRCDKILDIEDAAGAAHGALYSAVMNAADGLRDAIK